MRSNVCVGNSQLGEVEIKRGISQGDSLSPLVFVWALVLLSLILRKAKAAKEAKSRLIIFYSWMSRSYTGAMRKDWTRSFRQYMF